MISSTNAAYSPTVTNPSAGHCALFVMTIVAMVFLPIVLLYQGWSFHVFRRRGTAPLQRPASRSNPLIWPEARSPVPPRRPAGGATGLPAP